MKIDDDAQLTTNDVTRRRMLRDGLLAAGGLAATIATTSAVAEDNKPNATTQASRGNAASGSDWKMMFDLTVRIPPGRLDDWNHFWGDQNVPLLEQNGQWLWGAWRALTGQQDTITHQWAYRDLAHYQAMAAMRATNPQVHALAGKGVPIDENVLSSVMTPLPYHPAAATMPAADKASVIETRRIYRAGMASGADHARLSAEYVSRATKHGAQLVGALESFFGWTPSYVLQVWRYPSIEQYAAARRAIEADVECQRLLTSLRSIFPHEVIDLHQPLPYSRIR